MGENANNNVNENQDSNNTENNSTADNNTENANSANTENNNAQGQDNVDSNSVKEQVAQIAAQARAEAFKLLGIDEKDTQTIKAIKAFMDTQKNENNSGNNTANNEIEKRVIEAETKVDLMKNGVQPQYVDDAVIIVMSRIQGNKDTDTKSVISELKNKYPNWFDVKNDDENNAGKKGTGNIYNAAKNKGSNSGSLGQRLAAQKKGNKPSKSFWS